jgi:hypothetical protein
MKTTNLWGELPEVPEVTTPEQILREQAGEITKLTNGQIVGEVDSKTAYSLGAFGYRLKLQVPTLNNYNVSLLELGHEIGFYPVNVISTLDQTEYHECKDEVQFIKTLGEILTSDGCRKVIKSLLAHTKSVKRH